MVLFPVSRAVVLLSPGSSGHLRGFRHAPARVSVRTLHNSVFLFARPPKDIPSAGKAPQQADRTKRTSWELLKKVSGFLWPPRNEPMLRLQVLLAVSCVAGTKLFGIAVPYWFKGIVDTLASDPAVVAQAFNPFGMTVVGLVLSHGLFRTLQYFTQEARGALFATVVQSATRKMGLQVVIHLHNLNLSFHIGRQTGGLSRVIDRGVKAVDRLVTFALFHIVPTALELILVCLVLYHEAGLAFSLTALTAVVTYSVFTFTVSAWRIGVRRKQNQADQDASVALIDGLINYETIKYFQNEKYEAERYDRILREYAKWATKTAQSLGFLNFGQQFIFTVALTSTLLMCSARVAAGTMTLGDLMLVNTLLMQLSVPLHFLGTVYRELQSALIDMENLFALTSDKNQVVDDSHCVDFEYKGGEIVFDNVSFRYGDDRQLLKNVSFKVPAGTSLGVVGPSGCGKSTVLRILFGFYRPCEGKVLLDGQDMTTVKADSYRKHMGVIPQDTVLFNDTVGYNIRYGNLEASQEEVEEAARKVGLHNTIMNFPKGYETRVGERGLKLSGGEKQRVAIARCLLRRAPILLADEASSALDTVTEELAMDALQSHARTKVVIAHRLSTIKDLDQILVLRDGCVQEIGSHDKLIAMGGLYAEMWNAQLQEEVVESISQGDVTSSTAVSPATEA